MKKMGDTLISKDSFSEVVIGNTSIVRAMIESGVKVVTSYPGSPTPEIASAINSIPKDKRPFYFEYSVNEKVATEVAFGASMNGHTSCVFFKSVGVNVAADSFVQLNFYDLKGGMIIVLGDDPGANSSQNEQDNRHLAELSYIPVYEPSTPGEVYHMFKDAVIKSRKLQIPIVFRITTHVCHAKEKVNFSEWKPESYDYSPNFDHENGPYVAITKRALEMKRRAMEKLEKFREETKDINFHKLINNNSKRGVITMGAPFLSLCDVFEGVDNKPDILKLGIIYPLPNEKILEFLNGHDEVKILEELDDILETKIKKLAYENNISCIISGKTDMDDWIGEYTPDKVYEILLKMWPELLLERPERNIEFLKVPERPPQLCPGCGHRPVFTALHKYLNEDDITVGDIGCHTLGFLPPHNIGQLVVSMGHSTATGSGLSLFNKTRRVIAFIGDSTFYHAGIPAIINAVFNKHKLTLIVLSNDTTGMTGHQDHPGSGKNFNEDVKSIPIKQVLEGLGVENVRETGAYNQVKLIEHVKASFQDNGFSVIIADHPCMLKQTREQKKAGVYKNNKINILQDTCEKLMTCVSEFGCPSFQIKEDGSVWVHEDLCIGDGSCIQTCTVKAVKLKKKQ